MLFSFYRSHHSEAISIPKHLLNQTTDPVFLFDAVGCTLLLCESILQVLLWSDLVIFLVNESKTKVSNDPQKSGKQLLYLFGVTVLEQVLLDLQLL